MTQNRTAVKPQRRYPKVAEIDNSLDILVTLPKCWAAFWTANKDRPSAVLQSRAIQNVVQLRLGRQ
jgi:hypothetical protein